MGNRSLAGFPGRRSVGASHKTSGAACAYMSNEARPATAGCASGTWSAEPMRRPDHKAKKHGKPDWRRKLRLNQTDREFLNELPLYALWTAAVVPIGWWLRFDTPIWSAF